MDIYHSWCDLKPGVKDTDFAPAFAAYMDHLKERNAIVGWRLTRRKLGLAPREFGDFHFMIETKIWHSSMRRSGSRPRGVSRWNPCIRASTRSCAI